MCGSIADARPGDDASAPDAHRLDAIAIDGEVAVGSGEVCVVGLPIAADSGTCPAAVCARAPSCCDAMWGRECIDLVATECPTVHCNLAVVTTGYLNAAVTTRDPGGGQLWQTTTKLVTGDGFLFQSVAWADYDNDGDADLAFTDRCGVKIYRNDGYLESSLQLAPVFASDFQNTEENDCTTGGLAWGDADDDGDLDLAAANRWGVAIVRNDFDGNTHTLAWEEDTHLQTERGRAVTWGDFNGDGDMDLVVATKEEPTRLWVNDGGVLTLSTGWSGPHGAYHVEACHLGTGHPTAPALLAGHHSMALFTNTGSGLSGSNAWLSEVRAPAGQWADMKCADVDGDGVAEIIAATIDEMGAWTVGRVHILTISSGQIRWSSPDIYNIVEIDVGDIDKDGRLDILVLRQDPGVSTPFSVLLQNPTTPLGFTVEPGIDPVTMSDTMGGQLIHFPDP